MSCKPPYNILMSARDSDPMFHEHTLFADNLVQHMPVDVIISYMVEFMISEHDIIVSMPPKGGYKSPPGG